MAAADHPRRNDADHCFVCGMQNPSGLRIEFRLDNGVCRGEFTPLAHHCGFDDLTHGGILFSVLDDVMANYMFLQGLRSYTAKSEIRYRNPLPIGCPLLLEGRPLKEKRNVVIMSGTAIRADSRLLIAECQASFVIEAGD